MFTLITSTEQHETLITGTEQPRKHSVICTGEVGLAPPAASAINYHLVCFALIRQFIIIIIIINCFSVQQNSYELKTNETVTTSEVLTVCQQLAYSL